MFSWFRPRCPIDLRSKVWIEYRLRHLIDRIGPTEICRYPILIPTADELPEIGPAQTGQLEDLLERLCDQLKIDRHGIDLQLIDTSPLTDNSTDAMGTYTRAFRTIRLRRDILDQPAQLLSTLIHELLHDRLLNEGTLRGDEHDHEQMTDLSACLFGCGIPLANSTFTFQNESTGTYSQWQIWGFGYLTSLEFGYALAVLHWWRGEEGIPAWTRFLRLDAQETFTRGLKFLRSTGDCWLSPLGSSDSLQVSRKNRLKQSQTDTQRLGALWEIVRTKVRIDPEDVLPLLRHQEASIRLAACDALYQTPSQLRFRDELYTTTSDANRTVRGAAIATFLKCYPEDPNALRVIRLGLADPHEEVVRSTLFGLWETRAWSPVIQDEVFSSMTQSLERVSGGEIADYLRVLILHVPSLDITLRRRFAGPTNRSELATLLDCLKQLQAESRDDLDDSK